jgi:ABC-type uncharacterized transport system permease subunit
MPLTLYKKWLLVSVFFTPFTYILASNCAKHRILWGGTETA